MKNLSACFDGVDDGVRTHDNRNHKQVRDSIISMGCMEVLFNMTWNQAHVWRGVLVGYWTGWGVDLGMLRVLLLIAAMFIGTAEARDRGQVWKFRKTHPCPASGRVYGRCPGWQVDHIVPLKCGGPDTPANMQWLTVRAHKDKTRREARSCRHKR